MGSLPRCEPASYGHISNVMPANEQVAMAVANRRGSMNLRGQRFALVACALLHASAPTALWAAGGGVVSWGAKVLPPFDGATHFTAVSPGGLLTLALMPSGAIAEWGISYYGPPAGLSNVVAIAAG